MYKHLNSTTAPKGKSVTISSENGAEIRDIREVRIEELEKKVKDLEWRVNDLEEKVY